MKLTDKEVEELADNIYTGVGIIIVLLCIGMGISYLTSGL
jgi:uncharacterized membrane protein AbrB (regulator of aidB expression)